MRSSVFILTQRLPPDAKAQTALTLSLTAEERTRSRHAFVTEEGEKVYLKLPRGTVLRDRDRLIGASNELVVLVTAKPEPVLTVTANTPLDLLKAAYHLGNRHIPLEIRSDYLRLEVDPVLKTMLERLGLDVREEVVPFQPEMGAYHHSH